MKFLIALLCVIFVSGAAIAKPNVVVIMTDDQDDTGSMAYMPKTLRLIAEHGVTFKNSFVNFSLCAPSRVSFFTGQAAHNHGIRSNSPAKGGGWSIFKEGESNTLPVWLKAAGYRTALIGKYMNGYGHGAEAGASGPVPPGWDLWFAITGDKGDGKYFNYLINENGTIHSFGHQAADYSTDAFRDRAVKFIGDQSGTVTPFFMLVATKAPHGGGGGGKGVSTPAPRHTGLFAGIQPPDSPAFNEADMSDKPHWLRRLPNLDDTAKKRLQKRYQTEIESLQSVDDLVEATINALLKAGKLQDTIIVFTSDNGYIIGEHRLEGKIAVYEGSIKVPLMLTGPGIPENQTRGQLVNNLDVVATIEELAGVKPGLAPDGHSLTPLFADANAPWRSAILVEGGHANKDAVVAGGSWFGSLKEFLLGAYNMVWGKSGNPREFSAVRTSTRKYAESGDGFEELYDLTTDPYELQNKSGDSAYANDLAALRKIARDLASCAGKSCWISP
jgi:N-acetylglucosamine-6-sulfatase